MALAILTMHHWDDWAAGLAELCRVAPRRIVLTMDFEMHARFWFLEDYVPEVARGDACSLEPGYVAVAEAMAALTLDDVIPLLVPRDMQDGVLGAYWCRPEAYLDPAVRANCSGLALADPAVVARGVAALEADLASGAWQRRHADLADLPAIDLGYRLSSRWPEAAGAEVRRAPPDARSTPKWRKRAAFSSCAGPDRAGG